MELSETSKKRLKGVHPKLVEVVNTAAQLLDYPFNVSEGVRSKKRQQEMVNQGKSKTMLSKHLRQEDGYGHAVDLYPLTQDRQKIDWERFPAFVEDILSIAKQLGVKLTAGHYWKTFKDSPHFQL